MIVKLVQNLASLVQTDFPIDMVYLWCDGSEPAFRKRRTKYQEHSAQKDNFLSTGDVRFFDNDELKYSLRSLEKNAPWIRHIYIVTDRQIPNWINLKSPKITIIDHSVVLPKELIPCFNSSVIERYIAFIPGLSEYFLYGNDDTFFGEPVKPDFFFKDRLPIVRLYYLNNNKQRYHIEELKTLKKQKKIWEKTVVNAWELLAKKHQLKGFPLYECHHNIDAYRKSDYLNTFQEFEADLDESKSRFRSLEDIQKVLFSIDAILRNKAVAKILPRYSKLRKYLFWLKPIHFESYFGTDCYKSILALHFIRPILFCVNSEGKTNEKRKKYAREFLEKRFPQKSGFEV